MDQIAITAAAGLRTRMEAMDMLSNNLANTNTGGFKLDREFYSLFNQQDEVSDADDAANTTLPHVQKQWTDFRQGEIQPTGNSLDVALNGKGFFAVNGPSGILYTRNGSFRLSNSGVLTTAEGYSVRSTGGQTIQTSSSSGIEITNDGIIRQNGQQIGQFDITDFPDPASALGKMGGSYFKATDPSAKPTASTATVSQGQIEASNVVPAESAVRIVELMRQYEMLQKAVTISADMDKRLNDDVARVGS